VKTPAGRQTYYGSDRASVLYAFLSLSLSFALYHSTSFVHQANACACLRVLLWSATKKRAKKRREPRLWYGFAFPPSTLEAGDHGVESTIRSQRERYKPRLAHPRVALVLSVAVCLQIQLPSWHPPNPQRRPSVLSVRLACRISVCVTVSSSLVASNSMVFSSPAHLSAPMPRRTRFTVEHTCVIRSLSNETFRLILPYCRKSRECSSDRSPARLSFSRSKWIFEWSSRASLITHRDILHRVNGTCQYF